MNAVVIKLVIMLVAALAVTLALIGVEFKTRAVRPAALISKTAVAVVTFALILSII